MSFKLKLYLIPISLKDRFVRLYSSRLHYIYMQSIKIKTSITLNGEEGRRILLKRRKGVIQGNIKEERKWVYLIALSGRGQWP